MAAYVFLLLAGMQFFIQAFSVRFSMKKDKRAFLTAVINSKAQGIRDQERILGGVTYPIQLWDREQRVRMGVGLVTYPPDHHLNNGLVHTGGGFYH